MQTKSSIIKRIRDLWGQNFTMHPAPEYARGVDPLVSLMAAKKNHPKYLLDGQGHLIGLNLAGTGLTVERWQDIIGLLGEDVVHLQALNLSGNELKELSLPDGMGQLRMLDVSRNQLIEFALSPGMKALERLWLQGNEGMTSPPPEVVKQGNERALDFLRQTLEEGEDYLFEAKLLILGESGAGKTTFARKIQSFKAAMPKDKDTTRGIEVNQWGFKLSEEDIRASYNASRFENPVALKKALQKKFRVNLWDFGGQEIYHATHRFFLSRRSFYVLVADGRKQNTDFNYWMNIVEQLGGNSPLMVVVNEKQGHRWRFDETGLKGRFPFFCDTLQVDFGDPKDRSRLERLRRSVHHHMTVLPHVGDPLPLSWTEIRQVLLKEKESFISLDRYLSICEDHGINDLKRAFSLSEYFHDIGVFLHFQNDSILKNRIFLNANWTTKTVYKLLNDAEVKNQQGRFGMDDVRRIWPEARLTLVHDELLRLLERFYLAYRIQGTDSFIAPEHLPDEKPYKQWEHEDENLLLLSYEFDAFMPRGLMTELIVKLHHFIVDQAKVWRKGAELRKGRAIAEIVEAYGNEFRIDIRIAGKEKRDFLTTISNAFDEILRSFPKLEGKKLVPCNCERCRNQADKSFYKLSDLKGRLENDREEVDCPKNGFKPVLIRPMLDEVLPNWKEQRPDVHSLIGDNELGKALLILADEHNEDASMLRRQLNEIENKYHTGQVDYEIYDRKKNQISHAIMRMVRQKNTSSEKIIPSSDESAASKPWYKRWWTWLVGAIAFLAMLAEFTGFNLQEILKLFTQ